MAEKSGVNRVLLGGWYQRTTLHLSEVYDFFSRAESKLKLDKTKLGKLHDALGIDSVSRDAGYLEYIVAVTKFGFEIRYYEDGLYVLSMETEDVVGAREVMKKYYEESLAPALAYIFSLGAPTPKILANLKTVHPVAVSVVSTKPEGYEVDEEKYGSVYSSIKSEDVVLKKTPEYIFLISNSKNKHQLLELSEMQIFFREFKDQLEKYLNIHRDIWEEISEIKERKMVRGSEVEKLLAKLDSYQKTINLISSRINQMGSYVHTRASIARESKIEVHLGSLFQYKFDVLTNTHGYIKEIWSMTGNYLGSAIQVLRDIEGRSTNKSIQSLQIITTYGVVGGIIGYLSRDALPKITSSGLIYFLLLVVVTWVVNKVISVSFKRTLFNLNFSEVVKNL